MADEGEVRVVGLDSFDDLVGDWDALASRTGASPFSRAGWVRAWWSAFGAGELCIYTHRRNGELTAVLPLGRRGAGLRSCSNIHSPVFDAVAAGPNDLDTVLAAALREARGGLFFACLDPGGELVAAIRRQADGGPRLLELGSSDSSRVVPTLSWEEFEAGLRRKRRSDIRRSRKLLAKIGEVRAGEADLDAGLAPHLEEFLRLEGTTWKLQQGTAISQSPQEMSFYEAMATWAAGAGLLRLSFVWVGERPVSTTLALDDGRRRYSLKTGFDGEFTRCSPGVVQLIEDIQAALEAERPLELGVGGEALKVELSNDSWPLVELALFPSSVRGGFAYRVAAGRAKARSRARESATLRRGRDALRKRRIPGSRRSRP